MIDAWHWLLENREALLIESGPVILLAIAWVVLTPWRATHVRRHETPSGAQTGTLPQTRSRGESR